jgi:WD40 repeat protein
VHVRDAQTGQELLSLQGLNGEVTSVAFNPDGKRLAGHGFGRTKVWDAETGLELLSLKGNTHEGCESGVAFSPDGKRLVSGEKVWDAQTGQELFTLKGSIRVVFSPDGHRLASVAMGGTVRIWDATPLPEKP